MTLDTLIAILCIVVGIADYIYLKSTKTIW